MSTRTVRPSAVRRSVVASVASIVPSSFPANSRRARSASSGATTWLARFPRRSPNWSTAALLSQRTMALRSRMYAGTVSFAIDGARSGAIRRSSSMLPGGVAIPEHSAQLVRLCQDAAPVVDHATQREARPYGSSPSPGDPVRLRRLGTGSSRPLRENGLVVDAGADRAHASSDALRRAAGGRVRAARSREGARADGLGRVALHLGRDPPRRCADGARRLHRRALRLPQPPRRRERRPRRSSRRRTSSAPSPRATSRRSRACCTRAARRSSSRPTYATPTASTSPASRRRRPSSSSPTRPSSRASRAGRAGSVRRARRRPAGGRT